jgi:hypothetical protein
LGAVAWECAGPAGGSVGQWLLLADNQRKPAPVLQSGRATRQQTTILPSSSATLLLTEGDEMTKRKDGGQAFPTEFYETEHGDRVEPFAGSPGMTLRDWFAGQALAVLPNHLAELQTDHRIKISEWAYGLADAMISERDK